MELTELDKLGHGYAGVGIYSFARLACLYFGMSPNDSALAGVVSSFVVGGLKEAYDGEYGGTVETMDALATGLGGIVGFSASWEFDL